MTPFSLTDEHRAIRDAAFRYAEAELRAVAVLR